MKSPKCNRKYNATLYFKISVSSTFFKFFYQNQVFKVNEGMLHLHDYEIFITLIP